MRSLAQAQRACVINACDMNSQTTEDQTWEFPFNLKKKLFCGQRCPTPGSFPKCLQRRGWVGLGMGVGTQSWSSCWMAGIPSLNHSHSQFGIRMIRKWGSGTEAGVESSNSDVEAETLTGVLTLGKYPSKEFLS